MKQQVESLGQLDNPHHHQQKGCHGIYWGFMGFEIESPVIKGG
jgi:hypothetical protein